MSTPTTFLHLSDLHLAASGQLVHGIDSRQNVDAVLAHIRALSVTPAWIVVSGDLSEDGSAASYDALNAIVRGFEDAGIPVLLALGNHDDRVTFRRVVLGEEDADPSRPYHHSRSIDGVRIVTLDSVIPGQGAGALGSEQLAWLETELRQPAPNGTLIVIHHPCRLAAPARHYPLFVLHDAPALEAVLAGASGRILGVLAGHSHQANAAPFAGTLHATAPAVLCQLDFFAGDDYVPIPGSGYNLCRIEDGDLIVQPVSPRSGGNGG